MHTLRTFLALRVIALVWFGLSLGAAMAAPMVQPQSMVMVCSSGGVVKILLQTDDGVIESSAAAMHCPLCLLSAPPPEPVHIGLPKPLPLARAARPVPAARSAAATAALPPARAPPLLG